MTSVVAHYGEIALKGRNRPWFIRTLVRTIRTLLADLNVGEARSVMGRIEIPLGPGANWAEVRERLARLPGINNFSRAERVAPDLDAISAAVLDGLGGQAPRSFRIAVRRADKRFPLPSPEVERVLGRLVQDRTGWPVDLSRPDLKIHVEILTDEAFVYIGKEPGTGGLPVGTSGRVLCLLSGGIDSPVAAWRMIRRGCRAHFVHFHSYPILSRASQDKARELARLLTRHQLKSRLYLVPFGAIQQRVVVAVPPPYRVVIYRRLMVRIAEYLAKTHGAQALVTGDVVGQVASQTIENLQVIDAIATLPILRPLVGFDKDEITAQAERLGTYETSILTDEDCCTLFTPRFPTTRASREGIEAAEANLDITALVGEALQSAAVEEYRYPAIKTPGAILRIQ
ncbi:MAG TPA: tRNA uracil 4-sulfurtransferase ThiI [Vicinamibacterales bacterium]|nr:tRNA uracil 4-sulfurtransferase ThiI [Vicinamibacterales bacterium]